MRKFPKRATFGVSLIKLTFVGEMLFAGVAFYYWARLSRSQDYRYKMKDKHPSMLHYYYVMMEKMSGSSMRDSDAIQWKTAEPKEM